jgi:large subunit ribosomal protein L31
MNSGEVMMSNACQVGRGVRKPEASNGAMNMSRYISKSVLLLTLSVVICCGLYTLSPWVIGQGIVPFQANNSILTGPDSKVVGSRQSAQPFSKDEYFQPRPSAASHDASASTSSAVAASNNIFDQSRDFGAAEDPSLQRPTQRVCRFYDCWRCRRRLRTSVGALIIIEGYNEMKKNIHPKVHQVVFKDVSSDFSFLGTSTMDSKETIKWKDGKSYPLIRLEISSASHPFFTGKQRVPDTEGRIGRFKKKYGKKWIQAHLPARSGQLITGETLLIAGGLR